MGKKMNKVKTYIISIAMFIAALTVNATNITIYDGSSSSPIGWYGTQENQETEPNTVIGQVWDMESFELIGTQLVMTGGFNFTTPTGYGGFDPGDIFFDVNGGGYDYVAIVSNVGITYDVYTLPANTYSVYYAQNANSNPWKYKSGGTLFQSSLPVSYGNFSDAEGMHYTSTLDITWLISGLVDGDIVTVHNTMECGNDNLIGQFRHENVVPESGSSLVMIGIGGILLSIIKRRNNGLN